MCIRDSSSISLGAIFWWMKTKIARRINISTATEDAVPIFESAKASSYTWTVNVLVPALPPVNKNISSNLLKFQMKRKMKSREITPSNCGNVM